MSQRRTAKHITSSKKNKKIRVKFNSGFKFKVVVEALSERDTVQELARKHELHPNQISSWKKEFLQKGADVFGKEAAAEEKKEDVDKLYKVIGQQKMEIELRSNREYL